MANKDRRSKGRHGRSKYFSPPMPPQSALGVRGLKVMSGRIREEWNTLLASWKKEARVYLEMREDIMVGTMLDAIKLPLLRAPFLVETAPGNSPGDKAAADWLFECINDMRRQTWVSHVSDCLGCLDFGFSVAEIVLEKRDDGRLWLKNVDPRGQETLDKWEFGIGDLTDTALEFIQQDPVGGTRFHIPLSKCVHVTFRGRKGNPQGRSLLRSIFRPWRMCKDLEDLEAIGIERDVGGMPKATLPEGGDIHDDDEAALRDTLKNLRMDDAMYLLLPPGVDVEPYGGGSKMYNVGEVIERKQKEILGRGFAQFLKLGMDNVGTQALVQGSQDFFMLSLGSIQTELLEAWNQQLIPYLFAFNSFPGMTGFPELVWQAPGRVDVPAMINALVAAVNARLFTPTDVDEDRIREVMEWVELPESERGMPRDVEAPATPGLFNPIPGDKPEVSIREILDRHHKEQLAKIERGFRDLMGARK